ncbi:MAG: hypothetical protein HFG34_03145 [Eubacterium sp.]|nr:hypothetical protein [Eubacterium sp.]
MDIVKNVFKIEEHSNGKEVDLYQYTHIRAYHACRPLNIQDYLINGIQILNEKQALRESLLRIKSDYVDEEKIIKEFGRQWRDFDDMHKRVWLAVNKKILLTFSGHYLIYGSEFINTLAMELGCRSSLKKAGIPTIFHCDIPLENISSSTVMDIETLVASGYIDDISIAVDEVFSQDIVDYEHPKEVPDPFYYNAKYRPNYKELKEMGYISEKL